MKIGRFTIWLDTPPPSDAAAILGRHSAQVRKSRERERIRAKAREMCVEMGKPVPEALA